MLNQAKSGGKKENFFKKSGNVIIVIIIIIVSFKSNDVLHTQSHIHLNCSQSDSRQILPVSTSFCSLQFLFIKHISFLSETKTLNDQKYGQGLIIPHICVKK